MNKKSNIVLGALGLVALASACSVEMGEPQEFAEETSEALVCSNESATNVVMAGIAASAALEMKRWLPERDFVMNNGKLEVSQWGTARCPRYRSNGTIADPSDTSVPKNCKFTKNWLRLQDDAAAGMIIEGEALNPSPLRSRIVSYWDRQMICNSRPDNGQGDNCPVEYHDLEFTVKAPGACGDDFYFHAYKMGTKENLNAVDAAQLKNKLIFAGYPDNPYLNFASKPANGVPIASNYAGDVRLDPGGNSQGGGTTGSGSAGVYQVNPNTTNSPFCTSSIAEGAVSDANVAAALGAQCQCMTSPAQAVTTFKQAAVPGWLKCRP